MTRASGIWIVCAMRYSPSRAHDGLPGAPTSAQQRPLLYALCYAESYRRLCCNCPVLLLIQNVRCSYEDTLTLPASYARTLAPFSALHDVCLCSDRYHSIMPCHRVRISFAQSICTRVHNNGVYMDVWQKIWCVNLRHWLLKRRPETADHMDLHHARAKHEVLSARPALVSCFWRSCTFTSRT